jgi:hypothetical protein
MLSRLTYLAEVTVTVRDQARERAGALPKGDKLRGRLEALATSFESQRATLVATSEGGWLSGERQLREKLGELYGGVNGYEGQPSKSQLDQVKVLGAELEKAASRLDKLQAGELAAVNRELEAKKLAPVKPKSREEWEKGAGAAPAFVPLPVLGF